MGFAALGVLAYIQRNQPTRATDIAQWIGIGPAALSRQVAELENSGLLERTPSPTDARAQLISLTPRGVEEIEKAYERRAELLARLLKDWDEQEIAAAAATLNIIQEVLRAGMDDHRRKNHDGPAGRRGEHQCVNSSPSTRRAERPGDQAQMSQKEVLRSITGVLASFFAAMLATTIVSIALPTIMDALDGTQTDFNWVLTAALLANAATTPIWGKLADLFDKKKLLQLGIVIFVTGSMLAGFAINIPMLMSARVIQGIGMGGLTAMGMAVIGTVIPPRERGKYSGYFGGVMAAATAGGPLLGGLIVDSPLGWRWTFFIGVPIAIISMWLIHKTLHIAHVPRKVYIDWAGAVLVTDLRLGAADLGFLRGQGGLLRVQFLADLRHGRRLAGAHRTAALGRGHGSRSR